MRKETGNYVFPNKLAQAMSKISLRTQFEAELLSITFILVGLVIMAVYIVLYTQSSLFIKILTGVNAAAGFVFLSSRLVTSFQGYREYLQVMGIIQDTSSINVNNCKEVEDGKKKEI